MNEFPRISTLHRHAYAWPSGSSIAEANQASDRAEIQTCFSHLNYAPEKGSGINVPLALQMCWSLQHAKHLAPAPHAEKRRGHAGASSICVIAAITVGF